MGIIDMNCCDYSCTRAHNCPAGSIDDWTKANIKGDFMNNDKSGIDWRAFEKPTTTPEPDSWLATMDWLQHTIAPCLVSLVVGAAAATIYFLTKG